MKRGGRVWGTLRSSHAGGGSRRFCSCGGKSLVGCSRAHTHTEFVLLDLTFVSSFFLSGFGAEPRSYMISCSCSAVCHVTTDVCVPALRV